MIINYYKTKLKKMGFFATLPADGENWQGQYPALYFKKMFGFGKGGLIINTIEDGMEHLYYPEFFFKKLYAYIKKTNDQDYKLLAKKLKTFYPLKKRVHQAIPKINPKNITKLTNKQLISIYKKNRDWPHRFTVYDQFGWLAEDYWSPIMDNLLVKKYKIKKNSPEYYRVLFILTKPEEISTTLEEKRGVLKEAISIKQRKQTLNKAGIKLAKNFGWMPVFVYGTPWDDKYYKVQLKELIKKNFDDLKKEYNLLRDYTKIQKNDLREVIIKYKMQPKDVQKFIDFGLALDTRNEAEYLVSLAGYHMLPIYKEIAKRLYLSVVQVRTLCEFEIIMALEGRLDAHKALSSRKKFYGWGFNKEMTKRYELTSEEAEKIFKHVEKYSKHIQGHDESKGLCANVGKARGKAKIVMHPKNNKKVKNGDILITHITTVNFLPAMKRAAAFVTEIGGLTCHAAVVAREFGVPCVVSLKNATKNFRDGEMIEVDAENGIVQKVKFRK